MIHFSNRNIRASLFAVILSALAVPATACTSTKSAGLRSDWQVRAAGYLDGRAASWLASPPPIANVACAMSCHTTFPYVMARSALAPFAKTPSADEARRRFEARVTEAVAGTADPVGYVQKRLGSMVLHDRAMVLWASGKLTTLLEPDQAAAIAADLERTQLEDGGFSLGAWGQGALAQDGAKESDGYATAVAVLALCSGTPDGTERPDVRRGLSWLAQNQAEDGSWSGRSVNADTAQVEGFMTDAATAYASLALTTCAPAPAASR
jgi:hypothetical protein